MNDHMWKALERDDHPLIVFRLESYGATPAEGGGVTLQLRGALDMAGASHPVTLTAGASEEPGGALRVAGMHALDMTEWGISPPRLMLGTLRVRDDVEIHFDLVVSPR
jgi:polyisoprenoid-binding protein YceI